MLSYYVQHFSLFQLVQPNGSFISTNSGNVRLNNLPTELDTILQG